MMSDILNTSLMHPRDQIVLIISRIYNRGLTTTSGGNISIRDEKGDIWITPSAIDKGSLRPADIICVKKDGTVEGLHKPSSEFPFHKAIYGISPKVNAIIHAHPPALVTFSIVRQKPDPTIISQAFHVCGSIGYADYRLPGSASLGEVIADEFAKGHESVIMENHGTVVGGADISDAFMRFEALEFCARTLLFGNMVGKPKYLTEDQIAEFDAQIPRLMPELETVEHPSDERAIRREICDIVHRACRQGLMLSSYGTVSVRWRDNDFLITPTNIPRWDMTLEDIVQVKDGKREPGKLPSRTTYLHQQIYNNHPEINSIILTQPPYLMAFATTSSAFDVRTIPESWIFLQDVYKVPFGQQFRTEHTLSDMVSKSNPAVLIENDCILVTGNKLLQTFDYLEVAEFSAKSLVMCAPVGQMVPINKEQVEELREAFLK